MIMLESSKGGGERGAKYAEGGGGETRFAPPSYATVNRGGAQHPLGAETPLKIKAFTFQSPPPEYASEHQLQRYMGLEHFSLCQRLNS